MYLYIYISSYIGNRCTLYSMFIYKKNIIHTYIHTYIYTYICMSLPVSAVQLGEDGQRCASTWAFNAVRLLLLVRI